MPFSLPKFVINLTRTCVVTIWRATFLKIMLIYLQVNKWLIIILKYIFLIVNDIPTIQVMHQRIYLWVWLASRIPAGRFNSRSFGNQLLQKINFFSCFHKRFEISLTILTLFQHLRKPGLPFFHYLVQFFIFFDTITN